MNKTDLRKKAKEIRKSLDMKTLSEKIVANILAFEPYKKAQHIMLFYPLEHEVDLRNLLNDSSKNFYLPKMNDEHLHVCPYKLGDDLIASRFNTLEPTTRLIEDTSILDIIFVPALLIDKNKNRLGYGGGFYDRFLSKQSPKTMKIVAIPVDLLFDEIPLEAFDIKIDVTICENFIN